MHLINIGKPKTNKRGISDQIDETKTLVTYVPLCTDGFFIFILGKFDGCTICKVWQYGLWSFQMGGTKLERFLPKNQHPQRKLLNFENWISGGLRSFQKSDF